MFVIRRNQMHTKNALARQDTFDESHYISEEMLASFKSMLEERREQLLKKEKEILLSLIDEPIRIADTIEQSANDEHHHEEFQVQEHEDYIRQEIEAALHRIVDGSYGYCEETGNPIGLKRLLAVPYARYCIKVQEFKEQQRKRLMAMR
jgi:DnaK suppressor protein